MADPNLSLQLDLFQLEPVTPVARVRARRQRRMAGSVVQGDLLVPVGEDVETASVRNCANPECPNDIPDRSLKAKYCSEKCRYRVKNLLREVIPERKLKQLLYNRDYSRRMRKSKRYQELKLDPTFKYKKGLRKRKSKYQVDISELPPKSTRCEIAFCDKTDIVFDHCHASKTFRGWICSRCNSALGFARDDPVILRSLANYLERHSAARTVGKIVGKIVGQPPPQPPRQRLP